MLDCAHEAVLVDDLEVLEGPVGEGDGVEVGGQQVVEVLDGLDAEVLVEGVAAVAELEDVPEGGEVGVAGTGRRRRRRREGHGGVVGRGRLRHGVGGRAGGTYGGDVLSGGGCGITVICGQFFVEGPSHRLGRYQGRNRRTFLYEASGNHLSLPLSRHVVQGRSCS